jgi:hypothetical protein
MASLNSEIKEKKEPSSIRRYYQICAYGQRDNTHHIREFIYKESDGQLLKVKTFRVKKSTLDEVLKKLKPSDYKQFATFDFDEIKYPSSHDVLVSQSELLSDTHHSGYHHYSSF